MKKLVRKILLRRDILLGVIGGLGTRILAFRASREEVGLSTSDLHVRHLNLDRLNNNTQQHHSLRMDEKSAMEKKYGRRSPLPLYQEKHGFSFSSPSRLSRLRSSLAAFLIAGITCFLFVTYDPIKLTKPTHGKFNHTGLVPFEAHVMSKCPDAKTCLEELVVPAMEQVVDMVDFRLSYIGSIDGNDTLRTYHPRMTSWHSGSVSDTEEPFHPPCLSDNLRIRHEKLS